MKRISVVVAVVAAVLLAAAVGLYVLSPRASRDEIKYGITPYQDSGLPVVAAAKGWYKANGLEVKLVPVTWDQVIPALSSGAIDVAIYNFNSFLPPYANASQGARQPVFYAPLFVFKGQAIMVRAAAGFQTMSESGTASADIQGVAAQLKGKRVAVTKGTELEQIVLAALTKAGLSPQDVQILNASPEDSLAAFLAGNVDAFAAGLTERVEARRHGGVELLTESDVMRPVVNGIITSSDFASRHRQSLGKLVELWFRTIRYIDADVPNHSVEIRDYLRGAASTRYSPEEYAIAWTFDTFPNTPGEANSLFNDPHSNYYWKSSWDSVMEFLLSHKLIRQPVPPAAYWGERTLGEMGSGGR